VLEVARGVVQEVIVALYLERSPELHAAGLAVLEAGGAYLPLDPGHPRLRLAAMLHDAAAALVLTRRDMLDRLPAGTRTLCVEEVHARTQPTHATGHPAVDAGNLAYVIYTSGSTGRPKGALLSHEGLAGLAAHQSRYMHLGPGRRVLQFASAGYDASVWESAMALLHGGTLVVAPSERLVPGLELTRLMCEERIHVATLPPSVLALLDPAAVPTLDTLVAAGERFPKELALRWARRGRRVLNAYGPTETTVCAAIAECTSDLTADPPIGRPFAALRAYVLDRDASPVPIGVAGELCVGGIGLARGYLGRADWTAARFLPDPFAVEPGARLYRTGDRCRWRPDGNLEFLGRLDEQLKVRGHRIEPGEIESALVGHPGIREAAIVSRRGADGETSLVAYVAGEPDGAPSTAELRHHLAQRLPGFMVPASFVTLGSLPRTPSGKIDRRELPAPSGGRPAQDRPYVAPRDALEQTLASVWADVLGVERVGVDDDFFALGGHSMLAVRLTEAVRRATGLDLPLVALFQHPTVGLLARAARDLGAWDAAAVPDPDLDREAVLDPSITGHGSRLALPAEPRRVLLTGPTGFLGAFLLQELLRRTSAEVWCLVRAADAQEARQRIEQVILTHGLRDLDTSRVVALPGDLARPQLGLADDVFGELAATLDSVYHNGARVSLVEPYPMLKAVNVGGTREVLRLACHSRLKPVHFVSTLSVFPGASNGGQPAFREDDPPADWRALEGAYARSKWVAESLVRTARARGLPVAIYRPGRIAAHSRTAASNPRDLVPRMLEACVRLGAVPELDPGATVDWTPVDYASQAVVHLSRLPDAIGKTFHIANPTPPNWGELIEAVQGLGHALRVLPPDAWAAELTALVSERPSAGRSADGAPPEWLPLILGARAKRRGDPRFDCRNTLEGLRGSGIACPRLDPGLIRAFLDSHFVREPSGDRPI
jgi:amino acid adenylation domain-containing protein/thioester reductase-like protein